MAIWRSDWQKFKKKYPDFEKSKFYKADVGPQMDSYEKVCMQLDADVHALISRYEEANKIGKSILGALKGYSNAINDLEKSGKKELKSVGTDFAAVLETGYSVSYTAVEAVYRAGKLAQHYEINFRQAG